jgi:hypothetical protein
LLGEGAGGAGRANPELGGGVRKQSGSLGTRPSSPTRAEIMGAGKFGPPGWQDDPDWKGWWGPGRRRGPPGKSHAMAAKRAYGLATHRPCSSPNSGLGRTREMSPKCSSASSPASPKAIARMGGGGGGQSPSRQRVLNAERPHRAPRCIGDTHRHRREKTDSAPNGSRTVDASNGLTAAGARLLELARHHRGKGPHGSRVGL